MTTVGLSSMAGLLVGGYGIVSRTIEADALRVRHGWHLPVPDGDIALLDLAWLVLLALLIPVGAVVASELWGETRPQRSRAVAFAMLWSVDVLGQYWSRSRAASEFPWLLPRADAWLRDGRSWYALMCVFALVALVGTAMLIRPQVTGHEHVDT